MEIIVQILASLSSSNIQFPTFFLWSFLFPILLKGEERWKGWCGGRVHACNAFIYGTYRRIYWRQNSSSFKGVLWSISSESDKSATRVRRVVRCPLISVGLAGRASCFDSLQYYCYTRTFPWFYSFILRTLSFVRTYAIIFMYSLINTSGDRRESCRIFHV